MERLYKILVFVCLFLFQNDACNAFSLIERHVASGRKPTSNENYALPRRITEKRVDRFQLFMGRAAAVRAATKGKTDAAKAKTNAIFGKKIIMAVKQGGSPDPNANRSLANIIKAAKANSVPVDVRS